MRLLLFILRLTVIVGLVFFVISLQSCMYNQYQVKLANGTQVKAADPMDRMYHPGDTVCLVQTDLTSWTIDTQGVMKDTIEGHYVHESPTDSVFYIRKYRIAVIQ